MVVAPSQLSFSVGQSVALTLVVTNTGGATALGVSFPAPTPTDPVLRLVSSPSPQDIPGGMTSGSFTWVYQAAQPGDAAPAESGGAGTDENDGLPVSAPAASWPLLTIETPAQLAASAAVAPAQVTVQQTFSAALRVANPGQAAALSVTPALRQSGTGAATPRLTRTYAVEAAGGGGFTLSDSGKGQASGGSVHVPTTTSNSVSVTTAAFLQATATVDRLQVSTGQDVTLRTDVANVGGA